MSETIRRSYVARDVKIDTDKREVTHLISDATLDRQGDVIDPRGWDLTEFKRNPVVLLDHDYRIEKIVARSTGVKANSRGLFARTKFADTGLGAQAFDLIRHGLARAWSVGFHASEAHSLEAGAHAKCEVCKRVAKTGDAKPWGKHFVKQELVEYSLVAVPANPSAVLSYVKQRGFARELFRHAKRVRDYQQRIADALIASGLNRRERGRQSR